jgi:outer membrane protein, heavy metal efflux system
MKQRRAAVFGPRLARLALGLGLLALSARTGAQAPAKSEPSERIVSLGELLAYAERHAPAARVIAERRGLGDAERAGAAPFLHDNPTLELGAGPRFGGGERDYDVVASLEQPLEVAGQRGLRREAAARFAERIDAEALAARWALRRELVLAYRLASVAEQRVRVVEQAVRFASELSELTRGRLRLGDASLIDLRVAESDAAGARQSLLVAELARTSARLRLCSLSGWAPEAPPRVEPELGARPPVPELATVLKQALAQHPELAARRAAAAEAASRVTLAEREAWPTVALGVEYGREGALEGPSSHVVIGKLSLPLPLWQHNEGERQHARVDQAVASAEQAAATFELRARIAQAHAELASAAERVALFAGAVAAPLEDSLALLRRGLEAGELPLLDVLSARERLLGARKDELDAHADYYRAWSELESAVGPALHDGGAR